MAGGTVRGHWGTVGFTSSRGGLEGTLKRRGPKRGSIREGGSDIYTNSNNNTNNNVNNNNNIIIINNNSLMKLIIVVVIVTMHTIVMHSSSNSYCNHNNS